jgi:hypothetical protein
LVERDGLDHCGDAAQNAEAQSGITDRRRSRQGTFDLAACKNQIHARDVDWLRPDAEGDRDAARTQSLERRGNRLSSRRGYQNDLRATERLQSRGRVRRSTVDVVMGAELLG